MTLRADTRGPVHHSFPKWATIIDRDGEILRGFVLLVYTGDLGVFLFACPFRVCSSELQYNSEQEET